MALVPRSFALHSFPELSMSSPFRNTISEFLNKFAEQQDYTLDGNNIYRVRLTYKDHALSLYVLEERTTSLCSFCQECISDCWRLLHLGILGLGGGATALSKEYTGEFVMAMKILKQLELRDLVPLDFLNLIHSRYKSLQTPTSNLSGILKIMLSLLSPRLHSRDSPQAILALPDKSAVDLLVSDMNKLYRILMETRILSPIIETLLKGNILAKRWHDVEGTDQQGVLLCRITPLSAELERRLTRGYPPEELLILPRESTVAEFKQLVQQVMRDTYFVLENVSVCDVQVEGDELNGAQVLFDKVKSGTQISVTCANINFDTGLIYQGGNALVKCKCGATDFDSALFIGCAVCNVYQHMLCLNMFQPVSYYICDSCREHEQYFGEGPWGGVQFSSVKSRTYFPCRWLKDGWLRSWLLVEKLVEN